MGVKLKGFRFVYFFRLVDTYYNHIAVQCNKDALLCYITNARHSQSKSELRNGYKSMFQEFDNPIRRSPMNRLQSVTHDILKTLEFAK